MSEKKIYGLQAQSKYNEKLKAARETGNMIDVYNEWAKTYDETREKPSLKVMKAAMEELYPADVREKVVVMDVGAGSGLGGEILRELGFRTVDGLDPATEMLKVSEAKRIYRRLYKGELTPQPLDIPADTYDAITLVGVMGFGTVKCDAFNELVRLVKPGGFIVNCVWEDHLQQVSEYVQNWEPMLARMREERKWEVVKKERYANHFMGTDGILYVWKVL